MDKKTYPWIKFNPEKYLSGDISLEDYDVQGVFNLIMCYYVTRDGDVTLDNIKRKYRDAHPQINRLIEAKIIKVRADKIVISWVDDEFSSREPKAKTSRENGKKGGRPPKNNNTQETYQKPNRFSEITRQVNFENLNHNLNKPDIDKEEDKNKNLSIGIADNKNLNPSFESQKNALGLHSSMLDLKNSVLQSEIWRDVICSTKGIKIDDFPKRIEEFYNHCISSGKNHVIETEFKSHFNNWLRYQQPEQSQPGQPAIRETATERRNKKLKELQQQQNHDRTN